MSLAQLASQSGATDTYEFAEFPEAERAAQEMADRLGERVHLYGYRDDQPVHLVFKAGE